MELPKRKFYRTKEVLSYFNISYNTLWNMRKNNQIPEPVHVSKNCLLWDIEQLNESLASLWSEQQNKIQEKLYK